MESKCKVNIIREPWNMTEEEYKDRYCKEDSIFGDMPFSDFYVYEVRDN